MKPEIDYSLYLITDRDLMSSITIEESVEKALRGGCTLVQLREKTASSREFYDLAVRVKKITGSFNVPLIINDRADIALAMDADGVHIGQEDLPASRVRELMGPDRILGVSAGNLEQATKAIEDGADYLGLGAMYPTGTKAAASFMSMEELGRIREAVKEPLVVIGGINRDTVPDFAGSGIDGLAVVSAIVSQPDVEAAARELKELFGRVCPR